MSAALAAGPLATPVPWNLVADAYAVESVPHFEKYAADALELSQVKSGQRVLDDAAGPGTLSVLAARKGAVVSAIDFSPAMLTRLKSRVMKEHVEVEASLADGTRLPFSDGRFDAAFSLFGLIFFPDRARGFSELRRVVKTGGRVVVSSWVPMERSPHLAEIFSALRAELPDLPFGDGRSPLGEPEEFEAEMKAARFRDVSIQECTHALSAGSIDELFLSMSRCNAPFALLREKLGAEAFQRVSESVLKRLKARFGEGPQRVEMTALLGVGVR